jgi:signal transduction histidine kinase
MRIEQIVQNLLTNALRYAPESASIEVRVRRVHYQDAPDKAEIEVRDFGPGFAAEDLESLFNPFYQANHYSATHHGGLGLGLYIVRQLVTALGGDIKARSSEGQGAVFTIQLPLYTGGEREAPPATEAGQDPEAGEDA